MLGYAGPPRRGALTRRPCAAMPPGTPPITPECPHCDPCCAGCSWSCASAHSAAGITAPPSACPPCEPCPPCPLVLAQSPGRRRSRWPTSWPGSPRPSTLPAPTPISCARTRRRRCSAARSKARRTRSPAWPACPPCCNCWTLPPKAPACSISAAAPAGSPAAWPPWGRRSLATDVSPKVLDLGRRFLARDPLAGELRVDVPPLRRRSTSPPRMPAWTASCRSTPSTTCWTRRRRWRRWPAC